MKTIFRIQAADGSYLRKTSWGPGKFGGRVPRNFSTSSALSNHISALSHGDRQLYDKVGATIVEIELVERPVKMFGIDAWIKGIDERRTKRYGR